MPTLADYQGLSAAFGLMCGLFAMAPAFLCGIARVVVAAVWPRGAN